MKLSRGYKLVADDGAPDLRARVRFSLTPCFLKMKNPIDQLIWNDMNEISHYCPNCHQRMKQRRDHIDWWYCPNPKCNGHEK